MIAAAAPPGVPALTALVAQGGKVLELPMPDNHVPPSRPFAKLVPFTHAPTGISGLRPDSWTLVDSDHGFQISSDPAAPDGFIGTLITPDTYPAGGAAQASRDMFDRLKQHQADGPPPVIRESAWFPNGVGILLIEHSGHAPGSTSEVRLVTYARITLTSKGLLLLGSPVLRFSGSLFALVTIHQPSDTIPIYPDNTRISSVSRAVRIVQIAVS